MNTHKDIDEHCGGIVSRVGRRIDFAYRTGLLFQVIGAALLAVLYPLESPFYTSGIMLFEMGALLSAIFLRITLTWLKGIILVSTLTGITLQIIGLLTAPPENALVVINSGIILVCLGTSVVMGKEAYCFGYREGWILSLFYPMVLGVIMIGPERISFNSLAFSFHFLLLLSLFGKKLRQTPMA